MSPVNNKSWISRRLLMVSATTVITAGVVNGATHVTSSTVVSPDAPRLVVGVFVEGLSPRMLQSIDQLLMPGGISRLVNEGVVIENVDYGNVCGNAVATAMIMTGTPPRINGISSTGVYDRDSRRASSVVSDPGVMGNFTSEAYSPAPLRVSTLADELRVSTSGHGRVYSISADAPTAILAGGHAANNAVWINDSDGKWASSTYYKELPEPVKTCNYKSPLSARIDTITWSGQGFRYTFPRRDANRYEAFKVSPRANDEVVSLACDYLQYMSRGRSAATPSTDMLTIGLNVGEYPYGNVASALASEQRDAHMRLDRQIARLLSSIDATYGLDNTLVFIASTPPVHLSRPVAGEWRLPTGDFSPRKAHALLNMYLMALYGNGEWVTGYHDFSFYLNNQLAHEKGLDLAEFHRQAAILLRRMSGIVDAIAVEDAVMPTSPLRDYIDMATAGDVFIDVAPGWRMVESEDASAGKMIYAAATSTPAYILYKSLPHKIITEPVKAAAITAALAGCIDIRAPNGASSPAVSLK